VFAFHEANSLHQTKEKTSRRAGGNKYNKPAPFVPSSQDENQGRRAFFVFVVISLGCLWIFRVAAVEFLPSFLFEFFVLYQRSFAVSLSVRSDACYTAAAHDDR
jgi:hypothetical protein